MKFNPKPLVQTLILLALFFGGFWVVLQNYAAGKKDLWIAYAILGTTFTIVSGIFFFHSRKQSRLGDYFHFDPSTDTAFFPREKQTYPNARKTVKFSLERHRMKGEQNTELNVVSNGSRRQFLHRIDTGGILDDLADALEAQGFKVSRYDDSTKG